VLLTGLLLFMGSSVAMGFGVNIAESISDADHKTAVVTAIFLSCRLLQGIGQGFLDVSSYAVLTDQFSADLVTVIAMCEAAIGLGCLVGPPSGAALYEAAGFRIPFLVIGICSGLLLYVFAVCDFGILWSPLPEDLEEGGSKQEGKEEEFQISDLCHVKIIIPSLTVFVVAGLNGFIEPVLSQHFQRTLQTSITGAGMLFMISAATYISPAPFIGWITQCMGPVQCMLLGCIILCVGFGACLGPAPIFNIVDGSVLMWIVQVAFQLGLGLGNAFALLPAMPIMSNHLAGKGPRASDAISSLYISLYSLGIGIGPLLGVPMTHQFGLQVASEGAASVALCVVALLAVVVFLDTRRGPLGSTLRAERFCNMRQVHPYSSLHQGRLTCTCTISILTLVIGCTSVMFVSWILAMDSWWLYPESYQVL